MADRKLIDVPLASIHLDDSIQELIRSPKMRPYLDHAGATAETAGALLAKIGVLPLSSRYVWRIASALKWAFGDYDSVSVMADRNTLSPEDFGKLTELLRPRAFQFCRFLSVLYGDQVMEQVMNGAIANGKMGKPSRASPAP